MPRNKYETGCYLIRCFDKYGTRTGADTHAPNLHAARKMGRHIVREEGGSFVVMRVLVNSQDGDR